MREPVAHRIELGVAPRDVAMHDGASSRHPSGRAPKQVSKRVPAQCPHRSWARARDSTVCKPWFPSETRHSRLSRVVAGGGRTSLLSLNSQPRRAGVLAPRGFDVANAVVHDHAFIRVERTSPMPASPILAATEGPRVVPGLRAMCLSE